MDLFPAIDLQNGQCVRLEQGDFSASTLYEPDPVRQAARFAKAGATWLHIVDLDGAQAGMSKQGMMIAHVVRLTSLKVQIGGGIRDFKTARAFLDAGASRIILGSLAVNDPALTQEMLRRLGGSHVTLALDVRINENGDPEVLSKGWQSTSRLLLWDVIKTYATSGLKTVLCTDASRDGMMVGPNLELYKTFRDRWPSLGLLASGGIRNQSDVMALADLGTSGAIVGKALYEGKLDLAETITALETRHAG